MKRLSRRDLDAIGTRVFEAYKKLPDIAGMKHLYYVDPEILCRDLLGLHLEYQHLSLDGSVLGLTSFSEYGIEIFENDDSDSFYYLDGKTILVERELKSDVTMKGRCNFTIVHECSHQVLKMLYPKDYGVVSENQIHFSKAGYKQKMPITDWEEWQANTLASCILLPKELIENAMFYFGFEGRVKLLNRVFAPREYARFAAMADFLGSSIQALAIRMKQLGLLEKEYLDNPYALVDVEVD